MEADTRARARRRVEAQLVGARHVEFGEVSGDDAHDGPATFEYVSYYAHRIGNHFLTRYGYSFVLSNGFLQSHIYNLALSNIVLRDDLGRLERAFRYNCKKFYAECCLGAGNCFIGRALLLETLLFEQNVMLDVFDKADTDLAGKIANAMTSILNLHEMNHYFADRLGAAWETELRTLNSGRMGVRLDRWARTYRSDLIVEMACDAVAISGLISNIGGTGDGLDPTTRARIAAFCFLSFRELAALERSGQEAARRALHEDSEIPLGSEYRRRGAPNVPLGRLPDMEARCVEALRTIAEELPSGDLYGLDGMFPLHERMDALLRRAFDGVHATVDDGGLTTAHQRGLIQIVAEAMHGHDEGTQHLLWRSKTFTVGGRAIDP
ncbi:hypothetical protein DXV76_03480 [Rhodobacteraceae bacterium CCMM004]|nr:hypothetical protein DXV76_03480 [Rhodobacteraceae bacterium CCMM004]